MPFWDRIQRETHEVPSTPYAEDDFKLTLSHSRLRSPEPVFVNVYGAQESNPIPRNRFRYVLCSLAGRYENKVVLPARQAENWFLGSLKGLPYGLSFRMAMTLSPIIQKCNNK
jgi:hypothetical protein